MPWNPFVSKPAPPAGIVSHYHVFLKGEGEAEWKREEERKRMLSDRLLFQYYNSSALRP